MTQSRQDETTFGNALVGAAAGCIATIPMTLAMEAMHRQLPEHERYPLPPRQITMHLAEEAGIKKHLDEEERLGATLLAHFGMGTAAGSLYGLLAAGRTVPGPLAGAGYGLAVWAGNYLGLLPALGILRPATEHPPRRTALMIVAHLVWGAVLGTIVSAGDRHGKR